MGCKVNEWVCFALFRFLLPLVLLAATIFRFSGFSLLYGCLALVNPLIYRPTHQFLKRHSGRYLVALVIICSFTTLSQAVFQIYAAVAKINSDTGTIFSNCSRIESTLRQIGLQRVDPGNALNVVRVVLPDVCVFTTSIFVLIVCRLLLSSPPPSDQREGTAGSDRDGRDVAPSGVAVVAVRDVNARTTERLFRFGIVLADHIGTFLALLFLCLSGIATPSILTGVYFVIFLIVATLWSCCVRLSDATWFIVLQKILLVYAGIHLIVIYVFQFQFVSEMRTSTFGNDSLTERILGLPHFIQVDCDRPWFLHLVPNVKWSSYLCVAFITVLYFILAIEVRRKQDKLRDAIEADPLQVSGQGARAASLRGRRRVLRSDSRSSQTLHDLDSSSSELQGLIDDQGSMHNYQTMDDAPGSPTSSSRRRLKYSQSSRGVGGVIFDFILQHSYVGCLIVMMTWSITYLSWLALVFLIAACLIWIVPQKRILCLRSSPLIVFYAECLLIINYIYGFNLTDEELPSSLANNYKLNEIGLEKYEYPIVPLGIKVAFTFVFWLTLRQFTDEFSTRSRAQRLDAGSSLETLDGNDTENSASWIWDTLSKYWIFVCATLFLLMALQEAVAYRIIYMILFLYFVITFQISYTFWRFCVKAFWTVVILYSMVVLLTLYVFQFNDIMTRWRNATGMSEDLMADIGLEQFELGERFVKLLTPTSFLIFIILHLHYFQQTFLQLSDVTRYQTDTLSSVVLHDAPTSQNPGCEEQTERRESRSKHRHHVKRQNSLMRITCDACCSLIKILDDASVLVWRFLELHIHKLVLLVIFLQCIHEVSAINVVLIVLVIVLLPITGLQRLVSIISLFYVSAVILVKMIYQLRIVNPAASHFYSNCTTMRNVNTTSSGLYPPFNETINNPAYIGLVKTSDLSYYVKEYIFIVVLLAFEAIIRVHQLQHFNHPQHLRIPRGLIFPGIHRAQADLNLLSCAKFLVNYGFYKFGKEICFMMTVTAMVVRLDMYSVLYGLFLGALVLMRRRTCYRVWPIYIIILIIILVLEYLACLGLPIALCWEYDWNFNAKMFTNLKIFLYLPSYKPMEKPNSNKLLVDFFQLLFACLQWRAFREENESTAESKGGVNRSIFLQLQGDASTLPPNPTKDFVHFKESYLDYLKKAVFYYSYWATLLVLFIAATTRTNLFCMGYLIGCFLFLWFGQKILIVPLQRLLRMWYMLVMYCYFVLMAKCCLQIVGCVPEYLKSLHCVIVNLFTIVCLGNVYPHPVGSPADNKDNVVGCGLQSDAQGLSWDATSFAFLIVMLRICKTWYFQHIVEDLKIDHVLASRGGELINTRLIERVKMMKKVEEKTLLKIRIKMEKIRLRQQRLNPDLDARASDHYTVIRSGEHYMFDDHDDDGLDELTEMSDETLETAVDENDKKPGPLQILNAGIRGGTQNALDMWKRTSVSSEPEAASPDSGDVLEEVVLDDADHSSPVGQRTDEQADRAAAARAASPTGHPEVLCTRPDEEEETVIETCCERVTNLVKFAYTIICAAIERLIRLFSYLSRDYHEVSYILNEEKYQLLRSKSCTSPAQDLSPLITDQGDLTPTAEDDSQLPGDRSATGMTLTVSSDDRRKCEENLLKTHDLNHEGDVQFHRTMPLLFRLLLSALQVAFSRSELLCYFFMVLNAMMIASIPSLVYPILAFLWGMRAIPRPSKHFWVFIITYTEILIIVKYLFQFTIFPWNDPANQKNWPITRDKEVFNVVYLFGIETKSLYAAFDLLLLFSLFIHRSILMQHGLWKDAVDTSADIARAENAVDNTSDKLQHPAQPLAISPVACPANDQSDAVFDASPEDPQVAGSGDDGVEEKLKARRSPSIWTAPLASVKNLTRRTTNPNLCAATDVYGYMFFCDLICFVITVLGISSFGPSDDIGGATVATVIKQNKIPISFLGMLLVQFVLIIIDRALYLRKQVIGKIIFQFLLVLLVHGWMFFALPNITQTRFVNNIPAQLWYFTKCIYFALSSYQIRCGYPTRILGNFFTKKYNYFNFISYKIFLVIPFLLELRALMDWMFTDTTLALTSWLQMEDIFSNVFSIKCARRAEKDYPVPRGVKRAALIKYGLGGLLLGLLIFIIWFPLLLFSMSSTIYLPNTPTDLAVTMGFRGFQPIFTMSTQQQLIKNVTKEEYQYLYDTLDRNGRTFLTRYTADDISNSSINGDSGSTWDITPPSLTTLYRSLMDNSTDMTMYFTVSFTRDPSTTVTTETVSNSYSRTLSSRDQADILTMKQLADMINPFEPHPAPEQVVVSKLYPKYWTVLANGKPTPATELTFADTNTTIFGNVMLHLERYNNTDNTTIKWWTLSDVGSRNLWSFTSNDSDKPSLRVVSFNERVAPEGVLAILNKYGIIGLYVSMVLVVGGFVRMYVQGLSFRIMFLELPNPDLLLVLCRDIYMVRETGDFQLEEELFAQLIFLYRSPETLIKVTKYKKD